MDHLNSLPGKKSHVVEDPWISQIKEKQPAEKFCDHMTSIVAFQENEAAATRSNFRLWQTQEAPGFPVSNGGNFFFVSDYNQDWTSFPY